jgi:hypothetical protein
MPTLLRRLQFNAAPVQPSFASVARATNAVLGAWLAISGWIFDDPLKLQLSCLGAGVAITIVAINAFWFPTIRFVNSALAVWVGLSYFILDGPRGPGFVNSLLVSFVVFLVSLIPSSTRSSPERPVITPS